MMGDRPQGSQVPPWPCRKFVFGLHESCGESMKTSWMIAGCWLGIIVSCLSGQAGTPKKPTLLIDAHMHVWSGDPLQFPFAHPYDAKFKPPAIAATVERVIEEMD